MEDELYYSFEKELDNEAKRIIHILLDMYEKKRKVKKSFSEIVSLLVKKELKYYTVDINLRVTHFLPDDYAPDFKEVYALSKREEFNKESLIRYTKMCKKDLKKDHEKIAQSLVKKMIKFLIKHPNIEKGLLEFISERIHDYLPDHNDSVDARAIVFFYDAALKKEGYQISSLNPLRIKKI